MGERRLPVVCSYFVAQRRRLYRRLRRFVFCGLLFCGGPCCRQWKGGGGRRRSECRRRRRRRRSCCCDSYCSCRADATGDLRIVALTKVSPTTNESVRIFPTNCRRHTSCVEKSLRVRLKSACGQTYGENSTVPCCSSSRQPIAAVGWCREFGGKAAVATATTGVMTTTAATKRTSLNKDETRR